MTFRTIGKAIVGLPALFCGMAGLLLTFLGLGFITIAKYLVLLADDTKSSDVKGKPQ